MAQQKKHDIQENYHESQNSQPKQVQQSIRSIDQQSFLMNNALNALSHNVIRSINFEYIISAVIQFVSHHKKLILSLAIALSFIAASSYFITTQKLSFLSVLSVKALLFVATNLAGLKIIRHCVLTKQQRFETSYLACFLPFLSFNVILNILSAVSIFVISSMMINVDNFNNSGFVLGANLVGLSFVTGLFMSRFGLNIIVSGVSLNIPTEKISELSNHTSRLIFPTIFALKLFFLTNMIIIDEMLTGYQNFILKALSFSVYHLTIYSFIGVLFKIICLRLTPR